MYFGLFMTQISTLVSPDDYFKSLSLRELTGPSGIEKMREKTKGEGRMKKVSYRIGTALCILWLISEAVHLVLK
jgi:hypothetical protein